MPRNGPLGQRRTSENQAVAISPIMGEQRWTVELHDEFEAEFEAMDEDVQDGVICQEAKEELTMERRIDEVIGKL